MDRSVAASPAQAACIDRPRPAAVGRNDLERPAAARFGLAQQATRRRHRHELRARASIPREAGRTEDPGRTKLGGSTPTHARHSTPMHSLFSRTHPSRLLSCLANISTRPISFRHRSTPTDSLDTRRVLDGDPRPTISLPSSRQCLPPNHALLRIFAPTSSYMRRRYSLSDLHDYSQRGEAERTGERQNSDAQGETGGERKMD